MQIKKFRLPNDKYYTSDELAQCCIDTTLKVLKKENITEIVEPSAGTGSFSKKIKDCIAYDIAPEDNSIIQQDFLELNVPYKKGRLFIGNPPHGTACNLARQFCNKAFELGDYVAFILPISQLNNDYSIFRFDLIYSEDLGKQKYSGIKIHCCFNIYKRPAGGTNKRKNYKKSEIAKIIQIRESNWSTNPNRRRIVKGFDYDIGISGWGTVGRVIDHEGQYIKEIYVKVKNERYKDKIIELIKNAKWSELYPMPKSQGLFHWHIYKYLEDNLILEKKG